MQRTFWKNKRVLVTGHDGFVGLHLTAFLSRRGARVIGISRRATRSGVVGDVADKKILETLFKTRHPEICFHLAGISTVEEGTKEPSTAFEKNIQAALNVLELSRLYDLERTIIASTAHVYGDGDGNTLFREEDPPRPSRPYETSKTCVDLIAQSYADTYHLPVVIPRFVNIYGPGDTHLSRIIPKTIRAVVSGHSPTMWGGSATREYLYIDDAINAYDLLARLSHANLEKNRIYNFGTGDAVSVRELAQRIIELSGASVSIKKIPDARPDEISIQQVSSVKAKRILGWKPKVTLSDGLLQTIAWWRNYDKTH